MVAIELRFPTGRFHATPWNRQVNEGAVEWPPAPWRLLRALLAAWYLKGENEADRKVLSSLVSKLAALPEYSLPPATISHTRHYMPLYDTRKAETERTKVLDAFVHVGNRPVRILWRNVNLSNEERVLLDSILERLGYFGRAESWVGARVIDDGFETNSRPMGDTETVPDSCELVRTLTCMSPEEYQKWREATSNVMKQTGNSPVISEDVFEALQIETSDIKRDGWSQPPGSRWVAYLRPRTSFEPIISLQPDITRSLSPTVARYAIASAVRPGLTNALSLAERVHDALASNKLSGGASVFTGCDERKNPLQGHGHARIFCESNSCGGKNVRGEITHVTVYAPMGFDAQARLALNRLTKVWGYGGHDVQLLLLGLGAPGDFKDPHDCACSLFGESCAWTSLTPFIPTRHPKATRSGKPKLDANSLQVGTPEHDLYRLLQLEGLPEPRSITPVPSITIGGRDIRWLQFARERKCGAGKNAGNTGYGFTIKFPSPVKGPVSVGYGCHFGLGLFMPVREKMKAGCLQ